MTHEQIVRLVETLAYNLYSATLIGGSPEYVRRTYDDLKNPVPGDLVIELSTIHQPKRRGLEGIGRLIRKSHEPCATKEEWMESGGEEGEEIPKIEVWYIELVFDDGREFRWTNADFIKVPESIYPI